MFATPEFGLVWLAIHLTGIAASLTVRIQPGGRHEGLVQGGFLVSLMAVAVSTVIGYQACQQLWTLSAATLALMIVVAVLDFDSDESIAPNLEA